MLLTPLIWMIFFSSDFRYTVRCGNSAGVGGIGEYFLWNSSTPTTEAISRRQNSLRALLIVPSGNLWYSCIFWFVIVFFSKIIVIYYAICDKMISLKKLTTINWIYSRELYAIPLSQRVALLKETNMKPRWARDGGCVQARMRRIGTITKADYNAKYWNSD